MSPDDRDLATLLRADATRDEPSRAPDAMVPVRLGRRRLRTRRLAATGASVLVLGVGAATAVPLATGGHDQDPAHGIDPASQTALRDYDPQAMPGLMDQHVRAVLERSLPDLGAPTFVANDGQGASLTPDLYDKASGMSVTYGSRDHQLSVSLSHARSEAEGSATRYCENGLTAGFYLECTVDTAADGDVVISKLWALRADPVGGRRDDTLMVVNADDLDTVDPDRLYFEHEVKVVKSETLVTYVDERVKAPTKAAADAAFSVPVGDLVAIGSDPVLVIPAPPTDDSGCGPWTQDDSVTYC